MKKIVFVMGVLFLSLAAKAQSEDEAPHGFNRNNLYMGGSVGLGLGSYATNIGANPEIGYSLANWVDAGFMFNLNYQSIRADINYNGNVRSRYFTYGGGPYLRVYPIKTAFLQAQLESNFTKLTEKYMSNGVELHYPTLQVSSLLVGVGMSQRIIGQTNFYTTIMIDVSNNRNSPYISNGTALPIVRGGFNFYLRPKYRK